MLRIKSAENKDIPALSVFCKNSVLGTKILCQISAYGLERDFLSVWHCTTEDGEIVAAIGKFENSITLLCNEEDFIDDIKVFDPINYNLNKFSNPGLNKYFNKAKYFV